MVKIVKFGVCVLNDSVNSFEDVIEVFQAVFGWDITQAANCANIIHHKGEYTVKKVDSRPVAMFIAKSLKSKGLSVKVVTDNNETI
tara:strand:+ start:212 stop:469 length:258 start_codon:yes stop_codon:yes gene_type:complete